MHARPSTPRGHNRRSAQTRRGRSQAVVGITVALGLLAAFIGFAPAAFAHHPVISGVAQCQPDGTKRVTWSVGNSETSSNRYMLVRSLTLPASGTTTGLTADPSYTGPVSASYAGPGTVVAPGGTAPAITAGIPGTTTGTVSLSVTGFWSYGSTVVQTTSATVDLGAVGPCRSADLSVIKTSAAVLDRVNAGDLVRYTISVANAGPDAVNDVSVVDVLPTGATLAAVPGTDPCWITGPTGNPTCALGTMASGATLSRDIVVVAPTAIGPMTNRATVSGTGAADPNPANNVSDKVTTVTPSGTVDTEGNAYVLPGGSLSAADASTSTTFSIPTNGDAVDTALKVSISPDSKQQVDLLFGSAGNKDRNRPVRLVIDWGTRRICIFLTNCGTMIDPDNEGPQPLQVAVFCKDAYPGPKTGPGVLAPATNWRNGLPLLWCIDAQYRVGPNFRLVQEFIGVGDPKFLR